MLFKRKILVLDPDDSWKRVYREDRNYLDYAIDIAYTNNVELALKLAERNKYFLYITERICPLEKKAKCSNVNGGEIFIKKLREIRPKAKILMIAGKPPNDHMEGVEYVYKSDYMVDSYAGKNLLLGLVEDDLKKLCQRKGHANDF